MPRGQSRGKDIGLRTCDSRDEKPTFGFGVPATSNPHHIKVQIPSANSGNVRISEHLGMQACSDEFAVIDRVVLARPRWTAVRFKVQRAFNARLTAHGLKTCAWKVGENPVDRLLGKELCVLAWAIEDMEMEKIPIAIRNWLALRPEERWWLFGMTAIATGTVKDSGRGWRLALRYALGDLVQSDLTRPGAGQQTGKARGQPPLDLFGGEA